MLTDRGSIRFEWTGAHHLAATDYLRKYAKRSLLSQMAAPLTALLVAFSVLGFLNSGLSAELVTQFLVYFAVFSILSAIMFGALTSQPVRLFLRRRKSAIRCALEFDDEGVTVAIGNQQLYSPWHKVHSISSDSQYVYVSASCGCFAIPKSSFTSSLEAEHFATRMRRFLSAQKGDLS